MWQNIIHFISTNLLDLLLVIVGTSAFVVYRFQERRKISDAASLIVLQVNDLQKRLRDIQSYIVNGVLNDTAFYESQIIFTENYWDKYKHYFVRKIDSESFLLFNDFYACASEVLEQQQLMKNLQKNSFFVIQNVIAQFEAGYIQTGFQNYSNNGTIDFNAFSDFCRLNQSNIQAVIDQNCFIHYIPVQIRISLEKALKKYVSLQIMGSEGYMKLKKIANRKN